MYEDIVENIKKLFKTLTPEEKQILIPRLADELNVAENTVAINYLRKWEIPKKYRVPERILSMTQNYISNKNNAKQTV